MELTGAIDALLAELRLAGYSPETQKVYRDQLKRFAEWLETATIADLRRVSVADIDAYAAFVRGEAIGDGCRRLRIRAVKRLFAFLAERGRLFLDPAAHLVEPPRPDSLPAVVVGVEQLKAFLDAPDVTTPLGLRDRAVLEVLYATGIRVGELAHVELADVQLAEALLTIRYGKGGTSRVVPLGRQAVYWLGMYLREARPVLAQRHAGTRALFLVRTGRPLKQPQVREILTKYRTELDLPTALSPHDLRHACATHLLRAGADIRGIQLLLGHVRLDSTAIYTEVAAVDVKATHRRYHPKETGRADS
jgi:integrase/recombinase XerD